MTWVFWCAAVLVAYTYLGYPAWLRLRCRLWPRPIRRGAFSGSLSVIMVVRNEAAILARKLQNLFELEYPSAEWEVIVVSDGSTDATNDILSQHSQQPRFRGLINAQQHGKAAGLNAAVAISRSDLLVFTDVRQMIEPRALTLLSENFADPQVGSASGELMLGDPHSGESSKGVGLYWRIEKRIREMESDSGSVAGVTGAFYAARRECMTPVPPETILDDVFVPMGILQRGFRVVFDGRAHAWDVADQGANREFARKVRTLTGNYQLLQLMPSILGRQNPIRFEFISHKLLRLCVPFALLAILLSSFELTGRVYRAALFLQLAFYALGLFSLLRLKIGPLSRAADAVMAFVLLNTAALVAFVNFVFGRTAAWGHVPAKG